MKSIFYKIFLIVIMLPCSQTFGQECKVLVEILSTDYTGDCKKGFAHGQGTAIGDGVTYTGEFRKGYPNGEGTLTFEDGRVYTGEFKNGEIYGFGELVQNSGEVQKGYFKGMIDGFRYMGEDKASLAGYKIIETERLENATYTFVNSDPTGNKLSIKIFENNIRKITNFEILEITDGVIQLITNEGGRLNAEIVNVVFPVTIGIRYILPYGTQDTTLPGGVNNLNSPRRMVFTLTEPGDWTVAITHR
jgi:hypothetical protein